MIFDRRLLLAFILFSVLPAMCLQAPEPSDQDRSNPAAASQPTFKVATRLVLLDVVVTDGKGNPVTNLTKDDFTVVEDNIPQHIRSLELPSQHALPPGEIVHSTADLVKIDTAPVDIVVLDELNTPFEDSAFAIHSIDKFLKSQPPVLTPTELLVTNDKSFSVLQDFTQNLSALEEALKRNPVQYPWHLMRNGDSGPGGILRMAQTLNALGEIAQASAGTPGRKNIIWVGKGFPSVDLTGLDDAPRGQLQDAIKRCSGLLLASRVTLYVVDPTPLSSATYDVETPTDLATLESETLMEPFSDAVRFSTLAPMTGGRVFSGRNDVDREIASGVKQGSLYYTIAYTPGNSSEVPGEYRSVRIAINRPGLMATTRDGYYARGSEDAVPLAPGSAVAQRHDSEQVADVANAALSKMVYNGLKVRAGKFSPGRYSIAVDDASLSWESNPEGGSKAVISVIDICFNAKGKVLSHQMVQNTFSRKADAARASAQEIFSFPIDLPPNCARIRFVVRDTVSGRLGTADLTLP